MQSSTTIAAFATRRLRHDELRKSTHIARCGIGLFVVTILAAFVQTAGTIDAPGLSLLRMVIYTNVLAVMVTTFAFFTSTLSEERENGTLALLKLASEKDGAVLTGLVVPRLVFALALLAIQVPFALLAVTLGGVTAGQVVGCYAALCLSTILLCAVTTCAATLTKTAGGVVQLLIAYFFAAFVVLFVFQIAGGVASDDIAAAVFAALPVGEVSLWLDEPSRSLNGPFLYSVLGQTLVASALAWIVFPTSDLDGGEDRGDATSTRFRQWMARRRKFAPTNFDKGPHAWKDFNLVAGGHAGWLLRVAAYLAIPVIVSLIALLTWSGIRTNVFNQSAMQAALRTFGSSLTSIVWIALPIECAWLAARRVRIELDDQNWDLLELLPTSRQFIIAGKGTGTLQGLLPGFLLGFVGLLATGLSQSFEAAVVATLFGGVFGGVFLAAVLVCVWFVSSHLALRMKAGPATGITVLVMFAIPFVFVLPMMIFGGFGIVITLIMIPAGLGVLVALITSFSNKFYKRAIQGGDEAAA